MLADSFGRFATNLRVSVTERCNLRCTYRMPAEGLEWVPGPAHRPPRARHHLVVRGLRRPGRGPSARPMKRPTRPLTGSIQVERQASIPES